MRDTDVRATFLKVLPAADFVSLRYHRDGNERVSVRQGVLEPPRTERDEGAMVTVFHRGGLGYGATTDLSEPGLRRAVEDALVWAERSAGRR